MVCLNCTPATATLSEALAETVTEAPETVEASAGAVRETVGAVVSVHGSQGVPRSDPVEIRFTVPV